MAQNSTPVNFSIPFERTAVQGKTAIVTGGASGIGAGVVRALAEAGAAVVIADLNAEAGTSLSASLNAQGHRSLFVQTDVSAWESQVAAFKQAMVFSPSKTVDIVIACAGIFGGKFLTEPPFDSTDPNADPPPPSIQVASINVNLTGALYTATLATYYWRRQNAAVGVAPKDRHVLFVGSSIAYTAAPGFVGYTASKWGVRGFWKCLRADRELAALFRTNLIAPHIVRTPMTKDLQALVEAKGLKLVEIADVVECILRLCCDAEIRGRAIHVNPEGNWFDVQDDLESYDGAKVFSEYYEAETKPILDLVAG